MTAQTGRYLTRLLPLGRRVMALELFWPWPLLVIGLFGITDPLIVLMAIGLALLPWPARWLVYGRWSRPSVLAGPLLLLALSGGFSTVLAYDPALSWPMLLTLVGSISLFFGIVNVDVSGWRIAEGLVVVAVLVALYFVSQYGYFAYPTETGRLAHLGRMTGHILPDVAVITPHPNAVAGFLGGVFWLSLLLFGTAWAQYHSPGGRGAVIVWGTGAALLSYGLLITNSRGTWGALLFTLVLGGFLALPGRTARRWVALIGLGTVVFGLSVVVYFWPELARRSVFAALTRTFHSRMVLYRNTLYLIPDYLFTGIGLGDVFALVYSRYQLLIPVPFLFYAHQLFLATALGMGLPGLAALLWLILAFYRFVYRVEQHGLACGDLVLFRASWLGVTVVFGHGLTDAPQLAAPGWTMPMLFALLGLTVAVSYSANWPVNTKPAGEAGAVRVIRRRLILLPVAVLALVSLGLLFWRPLLSLGYANVGSLYQSRADLAPALDQTERQVALDHAEAFFDRALRLNPASTVANRRLGLLALDQHNFAAAITHLEQAYAGEPHNQATLKGLGLAYLWTGQLDSAERLLRQLDPPGNLTNELDAWRWWWQTQHRPDLSSYAKQMRQRLK